MTISEVPDLSGPRSVLRVDYGNQFIIDWEPTGRFMESQSSEQRQGGCPICKKDIVGEDARIYVSYTTYKSEGVGGKPTLVKHAHEVRKHFLVNHREPVMDLRERRSFEGDKKVLLLPVRPTVETPDEDTHAEAAFEAYELQTHLVNLEREVALTRAALDRAWRNLKAQPVEKLPFKSDVKIKCRKCDTPTFWRTGKGVATCYPACRERSVIRTTREERERIAGEALGADTWATLLDDLDD